MSFQLFEAHVPQGANPRQNFSQAANRFFAIRAAAIVFAGSQLVLDHGIADHQLDGIGNQERFKAQRAAIEHQRVVFLPVQGNELVHDPDARADELVFCFLAELRQSHAVRRPARLTGERQSCRNLDRCRRAESRAHGDFALNKQIRSAKLESSLL